MRSALHQPQPDPKEDRTAQITPQKVRRRRFLKHFRERLTERRKARLQSRTAARLHPSAPLPFGTPRARRKGRKRTAVALGVSAIGLSSTSQFALSADPLTARNAAPMPQTDASLEIVDPTERRHASQWVSSEELLEAMVEEEGVRYDVYRDVAGYPTVGVGHLVRPNDRLRVGDRISHKRALNLLEQDLKIAEAGVRDLLGDLPVNQHEFDALVDLVFNVGRGTVSEEKSPALNRAISNANYDRIAEQLDYRRAKNRIARGLIYRSERREKIFKRGDYSDPRES